MSQGRRYTDKEIAAIFKRATEDLESFRQRRMSSEGLSLEELQEIGKESGIPPDFIARAASSMDEVQRVTTSDMMGMQIGTGHVVDLPRRLTGEEWEDLVVDLRTTFNARGKIVEQGAFRQWTNGNLQFLLEPKGNGSQLVMKTVKGSAQQSINTGITFIVAGLIVGLAALGAGKLDTALSWMTTLILLVGFGMFLAPRFSVPQWASKRKEQMRAVEVRLLERMGVATDETETVSIQGQDIEVDTRIDTDSFTLEDADRAALLRKRQRG